MILISGGIRSTEHNVSVVKKPGLRQDEISVQDTITEKTGVCLALMIASLVIQLLSVSICF